MPGTGNRPVIDLTVWQGVDERQGFPLVGSLACPNHVSPLPPKSWSG